MTDTTDVADLLERLRANALDECDEAIDHINALADKLAEVEAELANGSFYQEKDIDALQARAEAAEAALPAVYRLGLDDAAWAAAGLSSQYVGYMSRVEKGICALPTPTAAELMVRINEGEKQ